MISVLKKPLPDAPGPFMQWVAVLLPFLVVAGAVAASMVLCRAAVHLTSKPWRFTVDLAHKWIAVSFPSHVVLATVATPGARDIGLVVASINRTYAIVPTHYWTLSVSYASDGRGAAAFRWEGR